MWPDRKKRWKAITLNYDRVLASEPLSRSCLTLSETTRLIALSLLEYARWKTRWDDVADASKIQEWYSIAAEELSAPGACPMFRQNPDNICQLQFSSDSGQTWQTAFDYSVCLGSTSVMLNNLVNIQASVDIEINLTEYNDSGQDIGTIHPNIVYDGTGDDANRDAAICYATTALLNGIYDAAQESGEEVLKRNSLFSSVVKFVTTHFYASDSSLLGVLGRVICDALFGTSELEAALAVVSNQDARDAVRCCVYNNLIGDTVTFARWNTAGTHSFTPGTDQAILADAIADIFTDLDVYLAWVRLLSEGVTLADIIGNDCTTCGDWVVEHDFEVSNYGYTGNWQAGQGFVPVDGGTGSSFTRQIEIENTINAASISKIEFDFDATWGTFHYPDHYVLLLWVNKPGGPYHQVIYSSRPEGGTGLMFDLDNIAENVTGVYMSLRVSNTTTQAALSGECRIHKVRYFGTGYNPFE